MSLPCYPTYKSSGVEWLGEVPAHWAVIRLKGLLCETDERIGDSQAELLGLSKSLGVLKRSEIEQGASTSDDYSKYKTIRSGELVMNKMQAWNGVFGLSPYDGIVSPDYATFRFIKHEQAEFLTKLFRTDIMAGEFFTRCRGMGTAFLRINTGDFLDVKVGLPPDDELAVIDAFLDRETAKIDALIAEQEKLLTLLAEKRQATISHAVTRGLSPNVPMKDSAIPWLGEVPAHWDVLPLKRDLEFLTSGSRGWAEHYADEGAIFVRIGNLTRDSVTLDLSDLQHVAPPKGSEGERTKVEVGDVLFSITAYLGSVAVVPAGLGKAYVSQHVALARLQGRRLLPKWVAYATLSSLGATYLATQGYGGTKVQLSLDDIAALPVTVPPIEEQCAALDFIEHDLARLEKVRRNCEAAIGLLKERRSALISAAVTGKIDVRGARKEAA